MRGIFLDFSKAFDTINHDILIQKLAFYNFSPSACALIESYLTNRMQFVKLAEVGGFPTFKIPDSFRFPKPR